MGTAQDYGLIYRLSGHTTDGGELHFEELSFIGAARVRQNWFLLSLILAPCCWTGRRVSSGKWRMASGGAPQKLPNLNQNAVHEKL
jgi:hypothetical protein